jgi:hypothetical protein
MKNSIHIAPHYSGGWEVKKANSKIEAVITPTKKIAVSFGKCIAKDEKSNLFIHGRDGKIQKGISY